MRKVSVTGRWGFGGTTFGKFIKIAFARAKLSCHGPCSSETAIENYASKYPCRVNAVTDYPVITTSPSLGACLCQVPVSGQCGHRLHPHRLLLHVSCTPATTIVHTRLCRVKRLTIINIITLAEALPWPDRAVQCARQRCGCCAITLRRPRRSLRRPRRTCTFQGVPMANRANRPPADHGAPSRHGQGEVMARARLRTTNHSDTARHQRTQATQLQICTTRTRAQCEA